MQSLHPAAVISPQAILGQNIKIGPYSYIEEDVEIGDNCIIGPHVCIYNGARIGKNVKIYQSSSVSNDPQDLKYDGETAYFYIGDNCVIREFATLHKGTIASNESRIGKNCLVMAYAHVAHDCIIGDNVILANSVQVGGHVTIDDFVIIGGDTSVHQFSTIGAHAMIGGGFRITSDIPPYCIAAHEPLRFTGLNLIGLRRRGFKNEEILKLKDAYEIIYNSGWNFSEARKELVKKYNSDKLVMVIEEFMQKSNRSVIRK